MARIVAERSFADIPEVSPSRTSMETVKAVSRGASFFLTIGGRFSFSARFSDIAVVSIPLVCRMKKATHSEFAYSAAIIRSPSFSRLSSSETMIALPAAICSIARVTECCIFSLIFLTRVKIL